MDKARECQDFGDDEYPNMICVEAGHVSTPVILLPGTAFEASQILQVNMFHFWEWRNCDIKILSELSVNEFVGTYSVVNLSLLVHYLQYLNVVSKWGTFGVVLDL